MVIPKEELGFGLLLAGKKRIGPLEYGERLTPNRSRMRQSFPRGTKVMVKGGGYADRTGTVEATVLQNTVDYPHEYAHGFQVTLDGGTWVTVMHGQVGGFCGKGRYEPEASQMDEEIWQNR